MTGQWRALSLRQPHASQFALGLRTIETRSWATKYRGPLVLCATAKRPPVVWTQDGPPAIVGPIPMERYWDAQEDPDNPGRFSYAWVGPLGAALATCTLVDCVPMVPRVVAAVGREPHAGEHRLFVDTDQLWLTNRQGGPPLDVSDQLPYGLFEVGRYAWLLSDVKPFREPQPIRGRQGLWGGRALDLAVDVGQHGYANVCRYCFAPLLHSEGWWCSDAHKAAFGRPVRGSGADVVDEFRVDGPVTDGERMELA